MKQELDKKTKEELFLSNIKIYKDDVCLDIDMIHTKEGKVKRSFQEIVPVEKKVR